MIKLERIIQQRYNMNNIICLHCILFRLNVLSTTLRKLQSLLRKSPFCTKLEYEYEYEKVYNLDTLSTSMIWSTEYDLEYEIVLKKVL